VRRLPDPSGIPLALKAGMQTSSLIRGISVVLVASLTLLVSACNGGDLATTRAVNTADPHNGGQDVPPLSTNPAPGDTDGDGIPDTTDNIPCGAFYLKVWNQGVSSATVVIDDATVLTPSSFPTMDVLEVFINPVPGTNTMTLGAKLAGSPGDELHLELWDTNGVLYMHETILRGNGAPDDPTFTFDINAQC
jgi:hypothetical protein